MHRSTSTRISTLAGIGAGALLALGAPVGAANVNIPEGGAVTPGSVFIVNFQAQEGCDGAPMDTLEVTIPDVVDNPLPEDVPGWAVETETGDDGEISLVRWSGGPLEEGRYLEFGMRMGFPDDPGATIAFPVVQRCGLAESPSEPTVQLAPRFGPRDIIDLSESQEALAAEVDELRSLLGGVDPVNLRSRVSDNEAVIEDVTGRLDEIAGRLDELEQRLADLGDG